MRFFSLCNLLFLVVCLSLMGEACAWADPVKQIYHSVNWQGERPPIERFRFIGELCPDFFAVLAREPGTTVEVVSNPFEFLKTQVVVSEETKDDFVMLRDNRKFLVSRNASEKERALVTESLQHIPHPELGMVKLGFADGAWIESDVLFRGDNRQINLDIGLLADYLDATVSISRDENPALIGIDIIHPHVMDTLSFQMGGQPNYVFAFQGPADIHSLELIRGLLNGMVITAKNGQYTVVSIQELAERGELENLPSEYLEVLRSLQKHNTPTLRLRSTVLVGTDPDNLVRISLDE